MNRQWWCANCRAPMELDIHGRCGTCGSDAVDGIERSGFRVNATRTHNKPLTRPSGVVGQNDHRDRFAAVAGLTGPRSK